MNFKEIFWLILLFSIIISIGFVSASDVNETSQYSLNQHVDFNILENENNDDNCLSEENHRIIYVNQNSTSEGNGSVDNPYSSLKKACNNLTGEEKVEINVYKGIYYLDSDLKFNTSNLFISGYEGEVIFKNLNNTTFSSIGLVSSSSNFTISNIVFDSDNCDKALFYVFKGSANLGVFNNCTFTNFNNTLMFNSNFNKKFNSCNFINSHSGYFTSTELYKDLINEFNYCIVSSSYGNFARKIYLGSNISFNNVWFGQNILPNYIYPPATDVYERVDFQAYVYGYTIPVTKYAIFSAYENYLGNHTYEIIGKLVWNDSTSDNIDKLNPMNVKLSSSTGYLSENVAILKNGSFKVTYKSNSTNNKVKIVLDSEVINLNFYEGIQVSSEPVYYGENQNVTINLPQDSKGNVTVIVENKTYLINVDSSLFNFTIPDQLSAGLHQINVTFIDRENHFYGSSNLDLIVLKNNFELLVLTPAEALITDKNITITVMLPNDSNGILSISTEDKNLTQKVKGGNQNIIISSLLMAGNNDLLIRYGDDVKYLNQSKSIVMVVNKLNPYMNISVNKIKVNDCILNISLPIDAKGVISIFSNNQNITKNVNDTEGNINISSIVSAGSNNIRVVYSGDEKYSNQIKSLRLFVEKIIPVMDVSISNNKVYVGESFIINLSFLNNVSGNISVKIADTSYLFKVGDILNVISNISGLNVINVTYHGDEIYLPKSVLLNVSVEKRSISDGANKIKLGSKIASKFTAKKKTFKAKTKTKKYSVFLKTENKKAIKKVKITLKINGKTYKATTNSKGKATFKIKKLTRKGKYFATIKFKGNAIYKSCSKKVKIVIKK